MKRSVLLLFATIIFMASISIGFFSFEEQIGQECGPPEKIIDTTYLFKRWKDSVGKDVGFIDCEGPSSFLEYRPLDIAAIGLALSLAIFIFAKRKH